MNAPLPTPPLLAAESDGLHLRRALLRLYVEYLPQNIIVVSVSAAVIGAILLSVVPLLWAAPWIAFQAAMSIYSAARIAAGRRRRARPERAMRATVEERVRRGELIAVSTAALSGASWGALVAYAPFISVEAAAGLMLASGGLAAGSATTMSAVPWAARLFAGGCILPTAFYLAAAGLPDSQGLSIVAVTMLLVMLSATSRVNARFVAQIGSERSAKQLLETTQAERERIEAALADSDLRSQRERARRKRAEEVYRSLYENAVFGIYRVSEDLKPLRVNAALAAMHGYASEEEFMAALGADIGREIYADPGRRDEFYRLLRENGRVTNFVSQMYRHKTREAIWVEENGWLVRDADGNVAYEGTTLDVTERVWAIGVIAESEAETKRAKERYELAVEASSTGIWSWDMDGGTIFQTRECRQLIGYADGPEAEEGVYPDTEFIRAIHPEDAIAAKGLLKRIRGANEVDAELRLRCADGAFRWFRLKGRAIRDQDDRIARVAGTLTDIDARKRQQAELRAVKERYELAVAGGKTGIWIWDFDAATIYESRECAILKGRPDDPATAEIVRSEAEYERTMHPDDIHPRNRYRRIVCETGGLDVELRYLCRDGAYRWFRQMGRAVRGADGRILLVIGSLTDIDERKRQADELRAVKERYELAVAGGRTGIWTWDFDAATLYESRECAILKGLPDDPSTVEVVHSEAEFARMVHPDDLVPPNRLRKMVRETGAINVELRYKCSDGQYRWFRLKGRAICGADGRVSSVTGSVTDIDESKRQAADLRTAKERYELAIAASATGIWSWDPAKHLMFESLECRRLLGYAGGEAEVPDANFMAAVHPDNSGPAAAIFDTLRRSGTIDIELRLRTAGGEHRWFRIRGEAVRDRSGRIVRVMGSLTDVDDKVRASRALEIALKAAKASERAKSEFLATMSHEIRTPMNGIIGMADALLDTPLAREQRRMSATIRESGESLLRIINDVLDISKFEAGGVALETAPFDLQPLLGFAVDVVARDARSKGIRIEGRLELGPAAARARRPRAVAPGPAQPSHQCGQVHRARLGHGRRRPCRGAGRRGDDRIQRRRYRHRHSGVDSAAAVRRFRAGRRLDRAPLRRHRAGVGDLEAHRRENGRHDRGREPRGRGLDLHGDGDPADRRRERPRIPDRSGDCRDRDDRGARRARPAGAKSCSSRTTPPTSRWCARSSAASAASGSISPRTVEKRSRPRRRAATTLCSWICTFPPWTVSRRRAPSAPRVAGRPRSRSWHSPPMPSPATTSAAAPPA